MYMHNAYTLHPPPHTHRTTPQSVTNLERGQHRVALLTPALQISYLLLASIQFAIQLL